MQFHFRLLVGLCILLAFLSVRATEISGAQREPNATPLAEPGNAKEKASVARAARDIPERHLDKKTMALLLEAEFALYRKNPESALGIYGQLARQTRDPGIAKRSVEIALATADPSQALDAALLCLDLAPDDSHAVELAARALARSAEVEGAWTLLNQYPGEKHEGKTYALRMMTLEAVRLATQMKDNYQIEWLLQQILGTYGKGPTDADVQLSLALIHEALGNFEHAAFYSDEVHEQNPANLSALRLHARSLLRMNQKEAAAQLLANWIKAHTEDTEARISLAQMLASFDQKAALPVLELLSGEYPWAEQLLMSTAQLHLASDRPAAAIPYYQKLTRFGNFRNVSLFNLGQIYEREGNLVRAAQHYRAVGTDESAADEENLIFEAGLREARIEYRIGENAGLLFEELRQIHPAQSAGLFHEEARLLLSDKRLEPAIDILSTGIEQYPDSEPLLYARSIAYERLGDVDAAIEDLITILSFDDTNSVALNALGYTLANRTDRYEEAYELIDRALSIDPEDPAIIDSMGWVLYRLGRYDEALKYLRQAHQSMLDEEIISHLAEVLWKLNRGEEAKELLEQGIIDLPDSSLIPATRTKLGLES